jgi:hypothetical protein
MLDLEGTLLALNQTLRELKTVLGQLLENRGSAKHDVSPSTGRDTMLSLKAAADYLGI